MTAPMFDLAARLKGKGALDADDTLALRRAAWPDGKIDPAEADAIFDLNDAVRATSPEWVDFFVEAMTVYIVEQQNPRGYVDDAKADWLMARIDRDGRVESLGELELVVKLLETATNVPAALKTYALRQIEAVVMTGTGPTRDGGTLDAATITASEVKLLRRILFAQAGDGPATISRAEAELLFRIKDATLDADNAPEWKTLFVQAVGNHLMVASNYVPLERSRAAELETFMNDDSVNVGRFLDRMAKASFFDGVDAIRNPGDAPDIDAFSDDDVDADETVWVDASLAADGKRDPLEEALVTFLKDERAKP
jgi:hypothetical protein